MSKISVIVPVYNTEQYINECIESLKKQTYTDLEIILINDGSNKNTTVLLERLSKYDERIKLFNIKKRQGVGAARNFGINKATGEFLYFLDSDDYLSKRTLELLIKNIKYHDVIRGRMHSTNFSSSFAIVFDGLNQIKTYDDNKFNLIKNNSVQNFLIRKDFIEKHNFSFSEVVDAYSDLSFMVPVLIKVDQVPYVKEALYFRRKRNDPITNPAISQKDSNKSIRDFLYMYNLLKDKYIDKLANEFLDRHILNFYRKDIVTLFIHEEEIEPIFKYLAKTIKKVQQNILKEYEIVFRREIFILRKGKLNRYKRMNRRHQFLRAFREGLKTKRKFYIFLYRRFFIKLPMKKNLVFFESFLGKNYSDSPKYIYEYMLKTNMKYNCIWSFEKERNIPGNPKQVERFSLRYFYYLARAKYWISNSRLPRYLDKREGNIYLQTWHGTPLKRLVFDMEDIYSADPNYKENFFHQSRRWDYLSSPNKYSTDIFQRAFKFNKTILEYGYPRNDILYTKNTSQDINLLKEKLGIPLDKKVILYAPTWRDDEFYSRGKYKFTLQLNLDKMRETLGEDYVVILRMHYFIASQMDISGYEGFIFDFSNYDDIAELYLISDILITDYSSVFFDYANLKRPILFYTYDLEKYRDTLRGFYIDIENEVPGPLLRNTDEIVYAIEHIDDVKEANKIKYDLFYNKFCKWDDGNASRKTIEKIFK